MGMFAFRLAAETAAKKAKEAEEAAEILEVIEAIKLLEECDTPEELEAAVEKLEEEPKVVKAAAASPLPAQQKLPAPIKTPATEVVK